MGLLSMALGKDSPVSQFVDQNKFAIHGAFSGLANGQNISQGLANAAAGAATGGQQDSAYALTLADQKSRLDQIAYERQLQQNSLQLQTQGANATADWLEKSSNPQVRALAGPVRNRVMTGADAIGLLNRPGQLVAPGDSVMTNQFAYGPLPDGSQPAPSGAAGASPPPPIQPSQPTQTSGQAALIQAGFTPSFSANGPATDTSSFYGGVDGNNAAPAAPASAGSPASAAVPVPPTATSVLPGSQDGSGRLAFVPAPTQAPTAAPAAMSAPMAAPAASSAVPGAPQVAFTAPTADAMKMTTKQRQDAAVAAGLTPGTPAFASFQLTGRVPVGAMETWRAPTKEELAAKGISPADAGVYQINSATQELRPVAGAMSADSVGANAPTVGLGPDGHPDPTQQAAFFAALPPSTAAEVKGIINYQLDLSKVTSLKGNQRQQMVQLATQADPTFDMTQYPARQAMKKSVTSGTISQNILSANTAIQHLSELNDVIDHLGNGGSSIVNSAKNAVAAQVGSPEQKNAIATFQQTATAAQDELAKLFKGSGVSDVKTIEDWGKGLDVNADPSVLHATVQNAIGRLLKARLDTIESQYQQVMGKPADFQILKPPAIAALKKLGIDPSSIDPNAVAAENAGSGAPTAGTPSDADVQALLQKYGT